MFEMSYSYYLSTKYHEYYLLLKEVNIFFLFVVVCFCKILAQIF